MRSDEEKSLRRRLAAFAVVAGVILLLFILRLAWFQLADGERYYYEATHPSSGASSGGG